MGIGSSADAGGADGTGMRHTETLGDDGTAWLVWRWLAEARGLADARCCSWDDRYRWEKLVVKLGDVGVCVDEWKL